MAGVSRRLSVTQFIWFICPTLGSSIFNKRFKMDYICCKRSHLRQKTNLTLLNAVFFLWREWESMVIQKELRRKEESDEIDIWKLLSLRGPVVTIADLETVLEKHTGSSPAVHHTDWSFRGFSSVLLGQCKNSIQITPWNGNNIPLLVPEVHVEGLYPSGIWQT